MSVNPAWAPTTPYQDAVREQGRAALLARWRSSAFVRTQPPDGFADVIGVGRFAAGVVVSDE